MGFESAKNWARKPRYEARRGHAAEVAIERLGPSVARLPAALVNFSRHGARLNTACPLDDDEQFTLIINEPGSGVSLSLAGQVRWQSPAAGGTWMVGCEFVCEVSLETLGEMFLGGILDEQPSYPHADSGPAA